MNTTFTTAAIALVLTLAAAKAAEAEVIIEAKGGGRLVGESLRAVSNEVYEVSLYRGLTKLVPVAGVASVTTNDLSRSADTAAFAGRVAELAPRDTAGGVALARWAADRGLSIQSRALLYAMRARDPGHRELGVLVNAPPAPSSLSDADRGRLERLAKLYFASPTNREPVLLSLRGTDAIPWAETERWARLAFEEARTGPKVAKGDTGFRSGGMSGSVHIELWTAPAKHSTNAAPAAEERWPVLVALHGGGEGSGKWTDGGPKFFNLFRKHFDRLIFVAPTVLQKRYAEWGGNADEELYVRDLLRAVKRTWPVDTDRVYLAGVSMGAYGVWHIGGHGADMFAGLVSEAGGILIGSRRGETWGWGTIGNLMHTPIAFVHGGKDEAAPPWSDAEADRILKELAAANPGFYRHKYTFYPSAGHGVPGEGVKQSVQWAAAFARDPAPDRLVWEPSRGFVRNFFWLRVEQPRMFTRLEASVSGNTVRIRSTGINNGLGVWIDPRVVDIAKPVTITVNDQLVFEGPVQPTLSAILESVDDKLDEKMWYPARVDF